ncbi:LLM class flavin-dependent oxidoreductase [Pararcticibacter amylolyticus]|uniref:Luciferase-like monooxygenase n=2 Tax=Pararcticibacter amylolyticus TaxID=2173175 RepID=A0A2U2PAW9_9SPHI|nr:LLM class flavin-dependent oxidoreductase [Pararcticibacter amylolyticus]
MTRKTLSDITISVLDLAAISEGQTAADSFRNSLDLALLAEKLGYERYWFAEHHNMINVASSATAVLIGYIAGNTNTIRVGSGGIMLPNHAPLIVAEQFGTLESLYPGRIDLGLGRAPGTDQATALAIRGENFHSHHHFPADVEKLQQFFSSDNSDAKVRANPGEGLNIPIWILGSSTDSAYLAASKGLPYAFASHFAPAQFLTAIDLYRKNFRPSENLKEPYVLACVNAIVADTDEEAEYLSTSLLQFIAGVVSGRRSLLQPPVTNMDEVWSVYEEQAVKQMLGYAFIGGPSKLKTELQDFVMKTGVDEIMMASHIFDHQAKLHSFKLFSEVFKQG